MSVTLEDLCQLMHDTYETAAIRYGWYPGDRSRMSWASVPEENRAAMRDAVAYVEDVIREDERSKHGREAMSSDLRQIMEALGMSTHARSSSPHEVVQREVLPKIRKMMETSPEAMQDDLLQIRSALGINAVARSYSPHEVVQKEILPKIHKMKKTLNTVKTIIERNYVEVKGILD